MSCPCCLSIPCLPANPPLSLHCCYCIGPLQATHIKLSSSSTKQSYESAYDCVLPDSASQAQVHSQVRQCVPSLLAGYNNTLMA
jgi:hypothetical protein